MMAEVAAYPGLQMAEVAGVHRDRMDPGSGMGSRNWNEIQN